MTVFVELDDAVVVCDGKIMLRTQNQNDVAKIQKIVPLDQSKTFVGSWKDGNFILEPATVIVPVSGKEMGDAVLSDPARVVPLPAQSEASPEAESLAVKSTEELRTIAAERSVPWDKKASRETMISRIVAAKVA